MFSVKFCYVKKQNLFSHRLANRWRRFVLGYMIIIIGLQHSARSSFVKNSKLSCYNPLASLANGYGGSSRPMDFPLDCGRVLSSSLQYVIIMGEKIHLEKNLDSILVKK